MNKKIKYRKEFYAFLREAGLYNDFMTSFKRESNLETTARWRGREETDIRSYLSNTPVDSWIVMAFSWTFAKSNYSRWSIAHDVWKTKSLNFINNEKINVVASTANTSDAIIANKDKTTYKESC